MLKNEAQSDRALGARDWLTATPSPAAPRAKRMLRVMLALFAVGPLLSVSNVIGHTGVWSVGTAQAQQRGFVSPQAAFEQGESAYKSGYFEIAVPALEHAASKGGDDIKFFAEFYLAEIFADTTTAQYDPAKAYIFYHKLVGDNADIDPDDVRRAPIVARALTALAGFVRHGVPDAGLKPDVDRALELYHHAATVFGDREAQFEMARLLIQPSARPDDIRTGLHFLNELRKAGHAGGQAMLADILWHGKFLPKDERLALALITVAVENAPSADRPWIDDIYQNIFCAASARTRNEANPLIAGWKKLFARKSDENSGRMGLGKREPTAKRTCSNGEPVEVRRGAAPTNDFSAGQLPPSAQSFAPQPTVPVREPPHTTQNR
jgi:uncharacterized protein